MVTFYGDGRLAVTVDNLGSPVGQLLVDLQARLSLRTWPELEVVPAAVNVTDTTGQEGTDKYAHLVVQPDVVLADRWYGLLIAGLPTGFAWPTYNSAHAIDDMTWVSRFRTGPEPLVLSILSCEKGTATSLSIEFSEPIMASSISPSVGFTRADGTPIDCTPPDLPSDSSTWGAAYRCPEMKTPFEVDIHDGLLSKSGLRLMPQHIAVVPEMMVPWGEGCRMWDLRPQIAP
jgi:hypothetical protein